MLLAAFFLLGAGALEILALIPNQGPGVQPMSQSPGLVAAQIVLAAAFVGVAGLCAVFARRLALAGAVIAAGIVICDIGLVISDLGPLLAYRGIGLAPWLQGAALVFGAGGAVCGLVAQPPGSLRRLPGPGSRVNVPIAWLTLIASVLLGVAFVPAWDRYDFVFTTLGRSKIYLTGNPFGSGMPWEVAVGTVLTAVTFAALPVLGVLLRPARACVLLIVGVAVVAGSQALSAVVGILGAKVSNFYSAFFTPAVAAADGTVLHSSLTLWFDIEVVAILALLVLVVARWWTPAGGSLFDSYAVDVIAPRGPSPMPWIYGSTAVNPPGTIGYGATASAWPAAGSRHVDWLPAAGTDTARLDSPPPGPLAPNPLGPVVPELDRLAGHDTVWPAPPPSPAPPAPRT
jgi:hypothetical protein